MAGMQTFEDYRSNCVEHGGRGYPFSIKNEHTRILVGSLMQELQHYHIRHTCPREITCRSIHVKDGIAYLLAASQPYSEEAAKKNYKDLGAFLNNEVFGGRGAQQFYSFGHFLGLLDSDQSLMKVDFIQRHYSILSTSCQLNFLHNLMVFGPFLSSGDADKMKAAIEKARKPENWEQVSSVQPFFRYMYARLGTQTDAIANLLYNGYSHVDDYNRDNPQANYSIFDLAEQINLLFPNLIVRIQIELDAVGMLRSFGIDPMDDVPAEYMRRLERSGLPEEYMRRWEEEYMRGRGSS